MDKPEYIERKALIQDLLRRNFYPVLVKRAILDAPAADVAPVVHARWEPYQTPNETRQSGWICTNCSGVQKDLRNGDTEYCPHCGAIMDGGEQDG